MEHKREPGVPIKPDRQIRSGGFRPDPGVVVRSASTWRALVKAEAEALIETWYDTPAT